MDLLEAQSLVPHLSSPAALAIADTGGKFQVPRHIAVTNQALVQTWATPNGRLAVNQPFQTGKSELCSKYFPAWVLLLWPETRIALGSYEERFSGTFGQKVRDIIERHGRPLGVNLRQDTQARNEWMIDQHEGGLVCKGRRGALTGRPADLLLLDDMVKDAEEALSLTILDSLWDWFQTVAYSRLGPTAPIVAVGTRWATRDLFGRIFAESRASGEPWSVLKFPALAEANDPLGRKPGEPLWPERQPLARLEMIRQKRGRWWQACWQQSPTDAEGSYFRPNSWPRYADVGDCYALRRPDGSARSLLPKPDLLPIVTVDWAISERETSDYTAFLASGITPNGDLLLLDCVFDRFRPETRAAALAALCRKWRPVIVAGEDDVLSASMALECRRYADIPEVRRLPIQGRAKLPRATWAIFMGEGGRIYLPDPSAPGALLAHVLDHQTPYTWLQAYTSQLASFTGLHDEHDDLVDCTALACRLASTMRGYQVASGGGPVCFDEGKLPFY